jgi:hypothetical protein
MKATFRITEEGRRMLAALDAPKQPMTRAEEVKALMAKGMKIVMSQGHCVWAFAPRKIAELTGVPFIAVMPAQDDLADYLALGAEVTHAVA